MFCYKQHKGVFAIFIVFICAIPFLWIISPIEVFLFFDDLGIFDCISRACWGNSMYCIDELLTWQWAPRSQTSNKKKPYTYNRYLFQEKHLEIACAWRALSRHVKTRRTEAKTSSLASRSICVDYLAIGRQVNQYRRPKHSLWLNKIYFWNSKTKIVKMSTQQTYRRFHRRNTSLSTVELIVSRACGSLII